MMKKKISSYIKLTIPAGGAKPAPPVGPALGQKGVKIMDFCNSFNQATKDYDSGTPIPVVITVFVDKSFEFVTKTPPVSFYLKKYAGVSKGSSETKKGPTIGSVTLDECKEIANIKMKDLNAFTIDAALKMVLGSALSMGIEVK
ncbi:MAG: 50S ribosomal protein L11 [Rickettsia sp.]|nr:50S ribosomal protein L11 [Rickettsia sp.]